jgi:hypothetical protein
LLKDLKSQNLREYRSQLGQLSIRPDGLEVMHMLGLRKEEHDLSLTR